MPLRAAGTPAVDILRLGHVELSVHDLQRSRAFYVGALGLVETESVAAEDGAPGGGPTLYLRGLEERGHHSLVLTQVPGDVAPSCLRVGFRVATDDDVERGLELFSRLGLEAARAEPRGQGPSARVRDPFGVPLELYARQEPRARMLQRYGAYRGAAVQRIDHLNAFAAELQATHDFYAGTLGFRTSEYTVTDAGAPGVADERLWAVWMHRKGNVHDLALTNGRGPRLHHIGLWTRGEMDIVHACDVLATEGWLASMERGPGRHGISNAFFLYLRDPDGHRIELFTGDYQTRDLDFEPIRWTLGDPQRQTLWGQPAPPSWFAEGTPFEGVVPRAPELDATP